MSRHANQLKSYSFAFCLFFALTFSACSFRLMYGYLDWILPWYLDDYVTLTDKQEKIFDAATLKFLGWHRSTELPRYAEFLTTLKADQEEPMDQQQVLRYFDDMTALWMALLEESMPDLVLLAQDFSDKQVQQINAAILTEQSELQEKHGNRDDEEQRLYYRDKMLENLEDWLGSVTDEQIELVQGWSLERINTTQDWLAYRDSWRQTFVELLANRQDPDFGSNMQQFLLQPQESYTLSYRQAVEENRLGFAQLIADLSATFSAKQRNYFKQELAGIIGDLNYLSNQES